MEASLARLCSMALRDGGRLFAEFYQGDDPDGPEWLLGAPDVGAITTLLRDAGAKQVDVTEKERGGRSVARLVGVW